MKFVSVVNAVLGDISSPGKENVWLRSKERIINHLRYVEKYLREQTEHMFISAGCKQKRIECLGHLHEYTEAGEFPSKFVLPKEESTKTEILDPRIPCFVDDSGVPCAVAYLMKNTVGSEVVNYVNSKYRFSFISDIPSSELEPWSSTFGFTIQELAMIQPNYPLTIGSDPEQIEALRRRYQWNVCLICLMCFLALLFPPGAMYWLLRKAKKYYLEHKDDRSEARVADAQVNYRECKKHFWINIGLTILGFVPGIIHAWVCLYNFNRLSVV